MLLSLFSLTFEKGGNDSQRAEWESALIKGLNRDRYGEDKETFLSLLPLILPNQVESILKTNHHKHYENKYDYNLFSLCS